MKSKDDSTENGYKKIFLTMQFMNILELDISTMELMFYWRRNVLIMKTELSLPVPSILLPLE